MRPPVEAPLVGGLGRMLGELAERFGRAPDAAPVFGPPVERGGVTVIPVTKVRWGFGGGGGMDQDAATRGEGGGGGGGVAASPMGYIEIAGGRTAYCPIRDPGTLPFLVPVILAAGISALLVLHGVRRLFRG